MFSELGLRGSDWAKWSKLSNFCFLLKKCHQVWGHYVPNFQGATGTRTPPKWGAKGGVSFFFRFQQKTKKKMGKIFCTFCRKSFKDSETVFFFYSIIKTEEVLFSIYINIYIYLYIYKKLRTKWKNFQEQKVFLFQFYILCESFSKIGP